MTQRSVQGKRLPRKRKIAFAVIMFFGIVLGLEFSLRLAGLGQRQILGQLRFGYDDGIPTFDPDGIEEEGVLYQDVPLFEEDSRLFWKPIPNTPFTGPNSFRLPEPALDRKETRAVRIAVAGDSCSFLGRVPWPARLAESLETTDGRAIEVINTACPGYASFQGTLRIEEVWDWRPSVLVIYFGWNDHWKSLNGCTDAELWDRLESQRRVQSFLGQLRTFQVLRELVRGESAEPDLSNSPVRVTTDQYRQNLSRMIEQARRHDCKVVLVSAPTSLREGQLPDWFLPFFGSVYAMSEEQCLAVPRTHETYNEIARGIAAESKCELADLAAQWKDEEDELFRADAIHLTEVGHARAAATIAETIAKTQPTVFRIRPVAPR